MQSDQNPPDSVDKVKWIKENYLENLKAREYYQQLHRELGFIKVFFKFNLEFIYDVLRSGRFKGSKMLDIGSGPTFHYVASASLYFPIIIQSDFVEDNLTELKRWLKRKHGSFDWSHFLKLVAEVEGLNKDDESNRQDLESRIRKSVKAVIKSDVLSETIISYDDLKDSEIRPPYDLVTSFWCLENVAPDFESYVTIIKRINNLLRPGGGIVIAAFENGGIWHIGQKPFHCLKLSMEQVSTALEMAGFVKQEFKMHRNLGTDIGYSYDTVYCVAAEKA